MGAATAIEIIQMDAVEWKRRCLKAEGKLATFERLKAKVDIWLQAKMERDRRPFNEEAKRAESRAEEELFADAYYIDEMSPKKNYFAQKVQSLGTTIEVSEDRNLGVVSVSDTSAGKIVVNGSLPNEGKAIGLAFQLLQIADSVVARQRGESPRLDSGVLHLMSPAVLHLLLSLGLIKDDLEITAASLAAYVEKTTTA